MSSASSKTASGTAFCLDARDGLALIGATSAGNRAYVEGLGCYGRVVDYAEVTALPAEERVRRGMIQVPEGRQVFGALSVEDGRDTGIDRQPAEVAAPGDLDSRKVPVERRPEGLSRFVEALRISGVGAGHGLEHERDVTDPAGHRSVNVERKPPGVAGPDRHAAG